MTDNQIFKVIKTIEEKNNRIEKEKLNQAVVCIV